ncbi:MAG: hypothetical protein U9O94_06335 [Nanoarchaeota archaeon]|nr:hypothetical protein [Nanoarchaeota archaeon]
MQIEMDGDDLQRPKYTKLFRVLSLLSATKEETRARDNLDLAAATIINKRCEDVYTSEEPVVENTHKG